MIANIAAYRFVDIADPAELRQRVRVSAERARLCGSVLIAPEGINLFLAGERESLGEFLAALGEDPRFADLPVKWSHSQARPFARLKVKLKREIISFRREDCAPRERRAPRIAPARLAQWIARGSDDDGRRLLLLDTRNREEVAHGSFAGALSLPIDNFADLPEALAPWAPTLADARVVSYCTGGIRCEKAALWMRAHGFPDALQLEGGILGYFEQVGGFGYTGDCFVFDQRVALRPDLSPVQDADGA